MGVDFDGVGGVGILFTDEMMDKAIAKGKFTREEWEDDPCGCIETLEMLYATAGSAYTGNEWRYLFVSGETLPEVNDRAPAFISALADIGIEIGLEDLKIISDGYVW